MENECSNTVKIAQVLLSGRLFCQERLFGTLYNHWLEWDSNPGPHGDHSNFLLYVDSKILYDNLVKNPNF